MCRQILLPQRIRERRIRQMTVFNDKEEFYATGR